MATVSSPMPATPVRFCAALRASQELIYSSARHSTSIMVNQAAVMATNGFNWMLDWRDHDQLQSHSLKIVMAVFTWMWNACLPSFKFVYKPLRAVALRMRAWCDRFDDVGEAGVPGEAPNAVFPWGQMFGHKKALVNLGVNCVQELCLIPVLFAALGCLALGCFVPAAAATYFMENGTAVKVLANNTFELLSITSVAIPTYLCFSALCIFEMCIMLVCSGTLVYVLNFMPAENMDEHLLENKVKKLANTLLRLCGIFCVRLYVTRMYADKDRFYYPFSEGKNVTSFIIAFAVANLVTVLKISKIVKDKAI